MKNLDALAPYSALGMAAVMGAWGCMCFRYLDGSYAPGGKLYDDIPEQFDNIIKFLPDIPDGPHSHDDHDEISKWNERLQQLMEKELASSNKNR